MRETGNRRRVAPLSAGTLLLAVIALAAPPWAPASDQPEPGARTSLVPSSVSVALISDSQQAILSRRRLRLRVASGVPGVVRLRARARGSSLGAAAIRIARSRRARFAKPGSRTIGLRLSARGREILAGCGATTLVLRARLREEEGQAVAGGADRVVQTAPLAIDAPRCGSIPGTPGGGGGDGGGPVNGNVIPPPQPYDGLPVNTATTLAAGCDFLDQAVCLQPWPNDFFTTEDPSSDTGRRVNLSELAMPRNSANKPIDPSELNRNDGFSPGNMLIARIPGLDNQQAFDNTGLVPIDDPGAYLDPNQPVVVINADTGERHPVWAEIDANPKDRRSDPGDDAAARSLTNLIVRPLENFEEGGHYVVGLRNLRDDQNQPIEATDAFRIYRDNLTLTVPDPSIENRRDHMEELFEVLGQAGIQRSQLNLAWDFSIASEDNLSERMLSIRDEAFGQLNDDNLANNVVQGDPPQFTLDPEVDGSDPQIARTVTGTMQVPCFMTLGCSSTGATFNYAPGDIDPDRVPVQNGTVDVPFECRVPRSALDDPASPPARPSLYGHGLLGSSSEVGGGNVKNMANEHNFVFCATDWYGFATQNVANILAILQDVSLFPLLVDGSQQGFLNFLYLGRLMIHPQGLISRTQFQDSTGEPLIDTDRLFYDGNSQGGILGGSLTAVAPDFRRAVLGVPGMNYSTLLRRSVDFEPYAEGNFEGELEPIICDQADQIPVPELAAAVELACVTGIGDTPFGLYDNYPNELERPLILSLMQMLWDRGEANGYAQHMTTDPLANTPSHTVLLDAAFGDHQVANVTAEVEARTIGASVYQPALDPGRHWENDGSSSIYGIPSVPAFPFGGSALVYWDGGPVGFDDPFDADSLNDGSGTPPNGNVPPRPPDYGADPHSYPRNDVKARAQKAAFLAVNGRLRNPCTTANRLVSPAMPIAFDTAPAIPCYSNGYLGP